MGRNSNTENIGNDMHTKPLLVTEAEAARMLSVCQRTVANLVRARRLACVRIDRAKRYDVRDLMAFIDEQKSPALPVTSTEAA